MLVGGFNHFLFSIIYGIILPIDYFFSRWLKPPTKYGFTLPMSSNMATETPLYMEVAKGSPSSLPEAPQGLS